MCPPGTLALNRQLIPSSGWTRMTRSLGRTGVSHCFWNSVSGGLRNRTTTSLSFSGSALPVRR